VTAFFFAILVPHPSGVSSPYLSEQGRVKTLQQASLYHAPPPASTGLADTCSQHTCL